MFTALDDIPKLQQNISLAPYNSWNIDAEAEYFWKATEDLIPAVLHFCHQNKIPTHYIGKGSNILISPEQLEGLTICTHSLDRIFQEGEQIVAQSGVLMPTLAVYAAQLGYTGYEFLMGIPGTIGGGIVMNAGLASSGRQEISAILNSAKLVSKDGEVVEYETEELKFGFRESCILQDDLFVLQATFKKTSTANVDQIKSTMATILEERKKKQPLSMPTAGSTFKNPNDNIGRSAGWLIDEAGLKGYRIGDAKISEKHANWIENVGDTTAVEILELIEYIQNRVYNEFNIWLEPEVKIIK